MPAHDRDAHLVVALGQALLLKESGVSLRLRAVAIKLRLGLAIEGDVGKAAVRADLADDADRRAAKSEDDAGVVVSRPASAAVEATMPFDPMPASVSPRCNG